MRRAVAVAALSALAVVPAVATAPPAAHAAPPAAFGQLPTPRHPADDLPGPAETKRRELRETAIRRVIAGKATVRTRNGSKVVRLGTANKRAIGRPAAAPPVDQYVELARDRTDKVFTILAEFGNQRHPDFPDVDSDPDTPGPQKFDGPLHNEIPQPGPNDNSTVWEPDFSRAYYQDLYFGEDPANDRSVKQYYEKQSSGRYSIEGDVSDWVKVPYNEARYGRDVCGDIVCGNVLNLITDALNAWVEQQKAAGKTDAQIKAEVAAYDQWDRNDYDGDGNFNEPDGYIDHFQIIHAGGDQADGDPIQGEDAIWSHRSAVTTGYGTAGPQGDPQGGAQIGNTGIWVGDYTMQAENGGMSTIAHEYGHDLGLPDEYDAATGGGSPAEWWSLMSQSRQTAPGDQGIGTRASDMGAWDKLQLGWLDYDVVKAGQSTAIELGPHEYNSAKPQAAIVVLPKKSVTTQLGAPASGTQQWWSGQGDGYDATLTSGSVQLPATGAQLTFKARWNIEDCGDSPCDYAYVEADDGTGFKPIAGSITNPAEDNGIDGEQDAWTPATFDLSAYAGKTVRVRLHYKTDAGVQGDDPAKPAGIFADDVTLTTASGTLTDGAEGAGGFLTAAGGFKAVGASVTNAYDNYYIASNRTYTSYDKYLQTGPYNFGFPDRPDFVEHFPYQDGLLVSYWNTQYSDNNVSVHPGEGEILVVDSHPNAVYGLDGKPWRGRVQLYDAPFGLQRADTLDLHIPGTGQPSRIRGQAAQPVFDDRRSYFDPAIPDAGTKVPKAGVQMIVTRQSGTGLRVRIRSTAAK